MKKNCAIMILLLPYNSISMETPLTALKVTAGYSTRQGTKPHMEDVAVMESRWGKNKSFFAVYDGHCGIGAAQFAADNLHKKFEEQLKIFPQKSKEELLIKTFEDIDEELKVKQLAKTMDQSGTTATVALLENNQLYLAWVGDSRALVIRNGSIIATTIDHKPDAHHEEQRIIAAGGSVNKGEKSARLLPDGFGIARALGNHTFDAKKQNILIAVPDILSLKVEAGDYIIIASDGLWDDLINEGIATKINELQNKSNQELYQNMLHMHFPNEDVTAKGNMRLRLMARGLCDEAVRAYPLADGTPCNGVIGNRCDNISVILIELTEKKFVKTIG